MVFFYGRHGIANPFFRQAVIFTALQYKGAEA
jgi:hypothetical protein